MHERGSKLQRRKYSSLLTIVAVTGGFVQNCTLTKPAQLGAWQRCERRSAKSLGDGSIEASQEQAARDSNYDIDKFVLSLWLAGSPARLFTSLKPRATDPSFCRRFCVGQPVSKPLSLACRDFTVSYALLSAVSNIPLSNSRSTCSSVPRGSIKWDKSRRFRGRVGRANRPLGLKDIV